MKKKSIEDLLADEIHISTPKILFEVVEDLEGFISDGSLREKPGSCSVKEIQEGKAWPDDLIYIEFESVPNGTVYILSCETFHGMGGVFKRIH